MANSGDQDGVNKLPFIADQRLLVLDLEAEHAGNKRDQLLLKKLPQHGMDGVSLTRSESLAKSAWKTLPTERRLPFLVGDLTPGEPGYGQERRLLCVTAAAGIGKSMALKQVDAVCGELVEGRVTVWAEFKDLPVDHKQYLDEPVERNVDGELERDTSSFLVSYFVKHFSVLRSRGASSLPEKAAEEKAISDWVAALLRCGQLMLLVDGLDEIDSIRRAKHLRSFLKSNPRCHCVVAGRPHAITQRLWAPLFSRGESSNDRTSDWEFAITDLFDNDQIRRFLGAEKHDQLQVLQSEVDFSGRTLEELRKLDADTFSTLRSTADVYWHSIRKSLELDAHKPELIPTSWMSPEQLLRLLAAIGVTMLMWRDDPHHPRNEDEGADEFLDEVPTPEDGSEAVEVSVRSVDHIEELYRRVSQRLARVYPEWGDKDASGKLEETRRQVLELVRLSTSYLECSFFLAPDPKQLDWRNVTQRDFFAALWMVVGASGEERAWFYQRIDMARDARDTSVAEAWRMICGMPDEAFKLQVTPSNRLWLDLIGPLYRRPDKTWHRNGRPTELMYRCWANLLRRAGFLQTPSWPDEDLIWATVAAQRFFHPENQEGIPAGVECRDSHSWQIAGAYLLEYHKLRKQDLQARKVSDDDLEGRMRGCDSCVGKKVKLLDEYGVKISDKYYESSVYEYELKCEYSLCAYQVTNRLYALFDKNHSSRFDDYEEISPYVRGAVVYLSWYDSVMFSFWCHGALLDEWAWEYSSRAGKLGEKGMPAQFPWGDLDPYWRGDIIQNAWLEPHSRAIEGECHIGEYVDYDWVDNPYNDLPSRHHVHTVGIRYANQFGIYDTIGNVLEWCLNRCPSDEVIPPDNDRPWLTGTPASSRAYRGGCCHFGTSDSSCSKVLYAEPHDFEDHTGCRVARLALPDAQE